MSVTLENLRTLAPELATVDDAVLQHALAAVPHMANVDAFGDKADLLTTYLALHTLALMGFGKAANGRVTSKSAAGVSVSYAVPQDAAAMGALDSTPWGRLYRLVVRGFGLRGGTT